MTIKKWVCQIDKILNLKKLLDQKDKLQTLKEVWKDCKYSNGVYWYSLSNFYQIKINKILNREKKYRELRKKRHINQTDLIAKLIIEAQYSARHLYFAKGFRRNR